MTKRSQLPRTHDSRSTIVTTLGELLEAADQATGGDAVEIVKLLESNAMARRVVGRRLRFQ